MDKRQGVLLIVILVLILFGLNYPFLDKALEEWVFDYKMGLVERVVDGDTIVVNGSTIRMLGINCPEKGERYYLEAAEFLEERILEKVVRMEAGRDEVDKYKRKLRYVFFDGNVNLELVKEGLANYYFPAGKDKYYSEFKKAWEKCVEEGKNLCEKSKDECANCIFLKKWDVRKQEIILENKCSFDCGISKWTLKDEGRKKYVFGDFVLEDEVKILVGEGENSGEVLYWGGESYVWTSTGDSLFLRDAEGGLVLWESY